MAGEAGRNDENRKRALSRRFAFARSATPGISSSYPEGFAVGARSVLTRSSNGRRSLGEIKTGRGSAQRAKGDLGASPRR